MSAVERQRVTKRKEPHPAAAAAVEMKPPTTAVDKPAAATPVQTGSPTPFDPVVAPKVPTSYRFPRTLLDRLEQGAVEIPAALGRRVSKNQIVEDALDEYLAKFNI